MKILFDGLSLTRDGFEIACQALEGEAQIGASGEVERLVIIGLRNTERRRFGLLPHDPLFSIVAAAVKSSYADDIVEYVQTNAARRQMREFA